MHLHSHLESGPGQRKQNRSTHRSNCLIASCNIARLVPGQHTSKPAAPTDRIAAYIAVLACALPACLDVAYDRRRCTPAVLTGPVITRALGSAAARNRPNMMHEQVNARRNVFNPGGDQIIYLQGPTSSSYLVHQSQMLNGPSMKLLLCSACKACLAKPSQVRKYLHRGA
jgi:hypothetical protein